MTAAGDGSACLSIIYDGECPFCSAFTALYRLKSNVGCVELLNAREDALLTEEYRARGYDINDGMLVLWAGQVYYGAEAMHLLSSLSGEKGGFNKLNRWAFGRQKVASRVYPVFVCVRKLALALLGRRQLRGRAITTDGSQRSH